MNVPVYVIAFNNPTYVEFMVTQLQKFKIQKIIVVDNNSTYPPLLEYYNANKDKFQLIRMDKNYGHLVVIKCFYEFLPEFFIITDPDLQFNTNLPKNFIEQLRDISIKFSAYKVGFALDLSDAHLFNKKMRFFGKTIENWEGQFWKKKINDSDYELYDATIDTTFAIYNKKNLKGKNIRVAGNFTTKHLPWYEDEKIPADELEYYLKTKNVGSWVRANVYAPTPSKRYLIISPQAGFGNRIRALCAGILVAKQTGRIPLHCWEAGSSNNKDDASHLKDIKKLSYSDYFEDTLPLATLDFKIDLVLTEWAPGDYWYTHQSTAQKKWNISRLVKVGTNLDILNNPELTNYQTILLETSLTTSLTEANGGCKNLGIWRQELGKIYEEYFKPKKSFLDMLDALPDIDMGFSIRRGDLLQYFPEARQEPNAILEWMVKLLKIENSKNICIFSEDHKFIAEFKSKLLERIQVNIITLQNNIASWEMGYLEFLVLGIKCKKIYGTPMSSFAEEAGLFRSKFHYNKILTPISEDIKLDLAKDVLPKVTIAILCKNKAHLLPIYLKCIYNLYYPKSLINLYVRTNDNNDKSADILKIWLNNVKNEYNEIYYDESSVNKNIMKYGNHEWNAERFSVLGNIRQDSILYAKNKGTDYFVVDCDNFIKAHTLMHLVQSEKSVIGPYLRLISVGASISMYSNFHADISKEGYHVENQNYDKIWSQSDPGIHKVNVIHCTYYIKNKVLDKVNYFDDTKNHEYVIFSRNLRKAGIEQFIDNTEIYGYLTFEDTSEEFWKKFSMDLMKQLLL